jgi:hypothetical protein
MSSCAIMQPTYLPWSGYFHLASKVDTFVFLDDVQFERSSWQSRNRILSNGHEHLLTVPIRQAPLGSLIRDIRLIQDIPWRKKHLHSIQLAYPKLWQNSHFREPFTAEIERPHQSLADLNIALIDLFFNWLEIKCRTIRASDLHCGGSRSQHLAEICRIIKCNTYYSPIGSREYLEEDNFVERTGICLRFCDFLPTPYSQGKTNKFASHLSIIDVIGNEGLEFTKSYIRKE